MVGAAIGEMSAQKPRFRETVDCGLGATNEAIAEGPRGQRGQRGRALRRRENIRVLDLLSYSSLRGAEGAGARLGMAAVGLWTATKPSAGSRGRAVG